MRLTILFCLLLEGLAMRKTKEALNIKRARQADALTLAEIVYDIYKEKRARENDIIIGNKLSKKGVSAS